MVMSETFVYDDKCQLVNFQIETSSKGLQGIPGTPIHKLSPEQTRNVLSR